MRTKPVSQGVLLGFLQSTRHRGSTKQESTLPEESFYKFLLCPHRWEALIQRDNRLYGLTSSEGTVTVSFQAPLMAWYPGISSPARFVSPGPSNASCSCCPMSTSQAPAHSVCPRAEQTIFLLLDGFCVSLKVQSQHLSENHLRYFPCTLRTQWFLHPLHFYDMDLPIMLFRFVHTLLCLINMTK